MDIIVSLITFLLWVILIFAFLNTSLTHFIFWFDKRLTSFTNEQALQISWLPFARNLLIEFFCIVFNCLLYPFRFWPLRLKQSATKSASEGTYPILFVHGYLHHQNAWAYFIYQLQKKAQVGPLYTLNLSSPFASIPQLAETLKPKIQQILAETNATSVILVGHSMGGLVCSYYSEYLQKPHEVAKVITLGSPFKGTLTAALGIGVNITEMSPNSKFSKELTNQIKKSKTPYYFILSKMDNLVVPWESGLISESTPENCLILESHSHLSLLISNQVIEHVYQWTKP